MKEFFDAIRPLLGPFNASQVAGIELLVKATEGLQLRHRAYILATAWHETARTMQPIEEYGRGKGRDYGKPDPLTGKTYYGRGYVQLTWAANYRSAGERLGVGDAFLRRPELVMIPETAAKILVRGMVEGWFTTRKLADYTAYRDMRRVVNGMDKADLIAGYAAKFERGLVLLPTGGVSPIPAPTAPEPTKPAPGPSYVPANPNTEISIMNSNAFQSLLTAITVILGGITAFLIKMGCTPDATGNIGTCDGSALPTWLIPYTAILTAAIPIIKLVIAMFQGKLTAPTAVVVPDGEGKPGVVTQSQVAAPK